MRAVASREGFVIGVSLLAAMAIGSLLIMVMGESPLTVYGTMVGRTWGSSYGIGQVLFKSTPLIFTGLAVAVAFRAGLFNIGAEGQMIAGSVAAAIVGAGLPAGTWAPLAVGGCLLAAIVAGAAVGALPGLLKARFGAHEVINTIMLNFIIQGAVLWIGNAGLFVGETTSTAPIAESARIPLLGLAGSAANLSLFLALAVAAMTAWFFRATIAGYAWNVAGKSPSAAQAGGIRIGRVTVAAMALSGGLAGLVAANSVLGYKHVYEDGFGRGLGFMGIAVALLGRNHPAGVVLAALLFGTLSEGGFAVSELVPKELVEVLIAVVILAVASAAAAVRRGALGAGGGR